MDQQLSSDVLEKQFGPTTIVILHQDSAVRAIQTVAEKTGQVLECSLVRFLPEGIAAFPEVHQAVRSGQSMGKAFRAANIEFHRETEFACRAAVPPALRRRFESQDDAMVVSVRILVGSQKIPYAQITETYTPLAVWPNQFGRPTRQALADLEFLAATISD